MKNNKILIREQSSTILSLFSSELKYMFPWSQYDDVSNVNQNYRTLETENKFNTNQSKLKQLHIASNMKTIKCQSAIKRI